MRETRTRNEYGLQACPFEEASFDTVEQAARFGAGLFVARLGENVSNLTLRIYDCHEGAILCWRRTMPVQGNN
jgi:hypothetical protein